MNRFVIVDGLPYLFDKGKTYAVRWDEKGFTVGAEVASTSVPSFTLSEISILAKCAGKLDSIGGEPEQEQTEPEQEQPFYEMTVEEMRQYAEENGIDVSQAKNRSGVLEALRNATGRM